MDKLVAVVGEHRFARAREWAWATAAGTGRPSATNAEWPADVSDVPHELEHVIWDEGSATGRVELAFELYREMPCYATLMYVHHYFSDGRKCNEALLGRVPSAAV